MKTYEIICVGTALLDSIIRGFDPEPVSASGYRAESGSLNVGGEAVNEAVALSKLGIDAGILCCLGKDAAGTMIESALKEAGVGVDAIQWETEHSTPITTMFVRDDGSRKSITNQAHRYNFHPEKQNIGKISSKAVILGSLFRAPFDDPKVIYDAATAAKERNLLIFADTKLPNFRFLSLDDIADSLPFMDYITPNEDEARYYTGKERPEDMADVFLKYGVKNVIIKLGARGCFFRNTMESIRLPAMKIQAVDATGAGDNFIAGFASEILRGSSCRNALLFANACGAICTTAAGAGTALKSREQVLAFLEEQDLDIIAATS